MAVVFVRTRHEYQSYTDYWRMVELAGFPTCYTDELDPASDNTYIVAVRNGENEGGWPGARARIIHWHAEYHVQYGPWAGVAETWSPDAWHAQHIGGRYVPMGGDARLKEGGDTKFAPDYDLAYFAYMVNRRSDVHYKLSEYGVRLSPISLWGEARHRALSRSTAYLHVHQTDIAPAVPALRMVVAAAYAVPVLMETVANRGIFREGYFMTSDYAYLPEFAHMWAIKERGLYLANYGLSLHELLCTRLTFRKSVEGAL